MNIAIIAYILGWILKIEGALMCLPFAVGLLYREFECVSFLGVGAFCVLLGVLLTWKKPKNLVFYSRDSFVAVALSWIVLSVFGSMPFVFNGDIPNPVNALFETISGFTTTGASILNDIEALSHCSLFWRSLTHWVGGMGILVFLLAVLPMTGGSRMHLMRVESPGPSVGKLVPKVRYTAMILYALYIVMTVLEMILLLVAGMPAFEAVTTAFGTAGTGGFAVKNTSMMGYSPAIQWIITVFMILFGVNFNAFFLILMGKWRQAAQSEEVRVYLGVIALATLVIFLNAYQYTMSALDNLRHAMFQVAAIITTTGFATQDFQLWPNLSKAVLVVLMFVGACAGSTGGGIKVTRILIAGKTIKKELATYLNPREIRKVKMDGKIVEHEVIRSVNVFLMLYAVIFTLSVFLIALEDYDLITCFTSVATMINNVGPGLELVGPTSNFSFLSPFSKFVLMFDMLAGRLELFPMIMLVYPGTWRRTNRRKKSEI